MSIKRNIRQIKESLTEIFSKIFDNFTCKIQIFGSITSYLFAFIGISFGFILLQIHWKNKIDSWQKYNKSTADLNYKIRQIKLSTDGPNIDKRYQYSVFDNVKYPKVEDDALYGRQRGDMWRKIQYLSLANERILEEKKVNNWLSAKNEFRYLPSKISKYEDLLTNVEHLYLEQATNSAYRNNFGRASHLSNRAYKLVRHANPAPDLGYDSIMKRFNRIYVYRLLLQRPGVLFASPDLAHTLLECVSDLNNFFPQSKKDEILNAEKDLKKQPFAEIGDLVSYFVAVFQFRDGKYTKAYNRFSELQDSDWPYLSNYASLMKGRVIFWGYKRSKPVNGYVPKATEVTKILEQASIKLEDTNWSSDIKYYLSEVNKN